MRKILTYISLSFLLFGIIGFLFNMCLSFGGFTYNGELPLTSIQGIEEKNDEIFVGLGFYNRIQVYDLNGKFIRYIKTNNHSKDYDFRIDEQGNPIINVIYLRKTPINKYTQKNGSEYFIGSQIPLIIEKKEGSHYNHLIKQPYHMSLWSGINSWVIGVIGVFIFILINSLIIMDVFGQNIPKKNQMRLLIKRIF